MRRVLGIDPASILCGYAIVEQYDDGALGYIDCGVLQANPRHDKWVRICTLGNDLRTLLAEHVWGLDDVCGFESAYVPRDRPRGVETLAEARGALCYVSMSVGLSIVTVAPSTVKKAVTGNGHADKDAVGAMVMRRLGLKRKPDPNASDALGVCIAIAQGAA